jgi:hypothetical protein
MENFPRPVRKTVEFPNYEWLLSEATMKKIAPRRAGMSQDDVYRRFDDIAEFIRESRVNLKLPQVTIATAIGFFQRYFVPNQLLDEEHSKIVAYACVFLAAKVEDTPKHPMKSLEAVVRGMRKTESKLKAGNSVQPSSDKLGQQKLYELRCDDRRNRSNPSFVCSLPRISAANGY